MKVALSNSTAITGYNGYIGKKLPFKDIVDLNECECDTLIHLACRVENTKKLYIENINSNIEVFNFCKKNNVYLIYISSNCVYPYGNSTTDSQLIPTDFYSLSKIASESLIDCTASILRLGDVFGKGQRHGNLFINIENAIKTKQPLRLIGNGKKIRCPIYIKDVINMLNFAVKNKPEGIYNVCYAPISVLDTIEYFSKRCNLEIIREHKENTDESIRIMESTVPVDFEYQFNLTSAFEKYIND